MLEPAEYARYHRELGAMIKRAGSDDPEAFAAVVTILDLHTAHLRDAVTALREPTTLPNGRVMPGYSWQAIADALGITKQAAIKRYRS